MAKDNEYVSGLWAAYQNGRSKADRDRLILHYSPIVKFVAARVASGLPRNIDQADLNSYGMFGLIDAIEKFEPERGFKFETYAAPRVKGAILDELRQIDWVPRSVRTKARAMEAAHAKLEATLNRAPTDEELAAEMGISEADLAKLLSQVSRTGVSALDEFVGSSDSDAGATLGDTLAGDEEYEPNTRFEQEEMRQLLARLTNNMPERERIVLTLYYYENLTLAEIGEILGVTESRICQIHTKAIMHLRYQMASAERV